MRRERAGRIAEVVDERRVRRRCHGRLRRGIAGRDFEVVVRAVAVIDLRDRVIDRGFHVGHVDQAFGLVQRTWRASNRDAVQRLCRPHRVDGVGIPVERHLWRARVPIGVGARRRLRNGGESGERDQRHRSCQRCRVGVRGVSSCLLLRCSSCVCCRGIFDDTSLGQAERSTSSSASCARAPCRAPPGRGAGRWRRARPRQLRGLRTRIRNEAPCPRFLVARLGERVNIQARRRQEKRAGQPLSDALRPCCQRRPTAPRAGR